MSVTAGAQKKGDMAVGGNLTIGTSDLTNFGIGGKLQYNILDPIRLEGSATYFLPANQNVPGNVVHKPVINMWDFSANGHYLFHINNKVTLYPLAGLSLLVVKSETKTQYEGVRVMDSSSKMGLNLGGGLDFKLTDRLAFNAEARFRISNVWDRHLFSVGMTYAL
jgi:outer membrane protein X